MAINPIVAPGTGGQRGFFNKYPYTDFHELNLDWLLENYQAIIDKVNQMIEWANNHQTQYEEAMQRLEAVENDIDNFKAEVEAAFARLKADIEADFAQQKAELQAALAATQAQIEAEMKLLTDEVNTAIASFENQFMVLKSQILAEIDQLKADVRREVENFYNIIEANNAYVFKHVDNKIEEFINSLPEILTVMVYNPYRGEVTDIQTAINDLYSIASIWGLTAEQYDSLGLTAAEYDALGLTALEYDTLGYKFLYKDPANYMISPFTGEYVPLQEVIKDLASLHMGGLTAADYDVKELTAEYYDSLELTAFNYDWFGDQLIA